MSSVLFPNAHEFGHSILYTYAYDAVDIEIGNNIHKWMDADGDEHSQTHFSFQLQAYGVAMTEGVATGIGQYVIDGCEGEWAYAFQKGSTPGAPLPHYFWYPWKDMSEGCTGSTCGINYFRWNMAQYGVAEGSAEWDQRLAWATIPSSNWWDGIASSAEDRYAAFVCDLMRTGSYIGHNWGPDRQHLDYLPHGNAYAIAQAIEGTEPDKSSKVYYIADVVPKDFSVDLEQLLEALVQFNQQKVLPKVGEPGFPEKNFHPSLSPISPQNLGFWMVKQGWFSFGDLNNVLRANYMEEIRRWRTASGD